MSAKRRLSVCTHLDFSTFLACDVKRTFSISYHTSYTLLLFPSASLTATMATAFQLFSDLPAELRVRIWHIALEDDYDDLNGRERIIELHNYNPTSNTIAVAVSRRYPTLFEVNREARCEAAKAGGGEWVTVSGCATPLP